MAAPQRVLLVDLDLRPHGLGYKAVIAACDFQEQATARTGVSARSASTHVRRRPSNRPLGFDAHSALDHCFMRLPRTLCTGAWRPVHPLGVITSVSQIPHGCAGASLSSSIGNGKWGVQIRRGPESLEQCQRTAGRTMFGGEKETCAAGRDPVQTWGARLTTAPCGFLKI